VTGIPSYRIFKDSGDVQVSPPRFTFLFRTSPLTKFGHDLRFPLRPPWPPPWHREDLFPLSPKRDTWTTAPILPLWARGSLPRSDPSACFLVYYDSLLFGFFPRSLICTIPPLGQSHIQDFFDRSESEPVVMIMAFASLSFPVPQDRTLGNGNPVSLILECSDFIIVRPFARPQMIGVS